MNTWHTSGGNNHRNGRAGVAVAIHSSTPKTIHAAGSVIASLVITESGIAYIADRAGILQAVDVDGKSIWKKDIKEGFHASPALNADGTVLFAASVQGNVMAVNAKDGEVLWKETIVKNNDPRILADVLYLNKSGVVITSSWQEQFYALNAKDGKQKKAWISGITPVAAASATNDESIYTARMDYSWENKPPSGIRLVKTNINNDGEEVVHFERGTTLSGKEIWTTAAPVIDEERGRIYYISTVLKECVLHCISIADKNEVWRKSYARQIQAAPCIKPDGTLIVGDMFGDVIGYDLEGNPVFDYKTGAAFVMSAPVCDANGLVFACDNEGGVHRITPDGKSEKLFEAARSIEGRPSISPQGKLYIPCMDGKVYVLG